MGFIKSVQRDLQVTDCSVWAGDLLQKLAGHQVFQVKTWSEQTNRRSSIYVM